MNTFIVHPNDVTTRFLCDIYKNIPNKKVVTGGITREYLRQIMVSYNRIICCGHGTINGLCANDRFLPDPYSGVLWFANVVENSMVEVLSRGHNNIYIWCHASDFVKMHKLKGFYSGMFISEVEEAEYCGFADVTDEEMAELNKVFAEIVGRHINEPIKSLYKNVIHEYGIIAERHPVARFNWERLYLS